MNGREDIEAIIDVSHLAETGKVTEDAELEYTLPGKFFKATRPWQPYIHFATKEVKEQDFTIVDKYPDGFAPWADILGAVFYGGGTSPFLLGLVDGLWDSRKAEFEARKIIEDIKTDLSVEKAIKAMQEQYKQEWEQKLEERKWTPHRLSYKDAASGEEGFIEVIPALGSSWVHYNVGSICTDKGGVIYQTKEAKELTELLEGKADISKDPYYFLTKVNIDDLTLKAIALGIKGQIDLYKTKTELDKNERRG